MGSTVLEVEAVALAVRLVAEGGVKMELDVFDDNSLSAAPGGGRAAVPGRPWNLVGNLEALVDAEGASALFIFNSDNLSAKLAMLAMKALKGRVQQAVVVGTGRFMNVADIRKLSIVSDSNKCHIIYDCDDLQY